MQETFTHVELIDALKCNGVEAAFILLKEFRGSYIRAVIKKYLAANNSRNLLDDTDDVEQIVCLAIYKDLQTSANVWQKFAESRKNNDEEIPLLKYTALSSWLYTICINACKKFQQSNGKHHGENVDDFTEIFSNTKPFHPLPLENHILTEECINIAFDIAKALSTRDRRILEMYYISRSTPKEIAEAIGTSNEIVRQVIFKANQELRKKLLDFRK